MVECGVVQLLRVDESGVSQLEEGLLESKVIGIFFVQYKFGELGVA